jgi:uncharacterized membrane protein
MNPFLSGALGALAVLAVAGLARRAAFRRFRRRLPARVLRRIGATPEQERAVLAETEALREALHALRADARLLRADLADLIGAPALDDARVAAALNARLAGLGELRGRVAGSLARIHAALGPDQRSALADLVRRGPHAHCGRARAAHA